ncbi:MAG: nucleotidyltransferase substrate binding protein [Bacteroidetes bacterium]|nr:nucleotidyltransferase substrate binding protein [Bacteroidota bacterium]
MPNKDIRWEQRFVNYRKALQQLRKFYESEELNDKEEQGMIKAFEYTYELAWNTIKDYYESKGEVNIQGSRDAFRLAFNRGLISDGQVWMDMVDDRKLTVHTYDEKKADEMVEKIRDVHFNLFVRLETRLLVESKTT